MLVYSPIERECEALGLNACKNCWVPVAGLQEQIWRKNILSVENEPDLTVPVSEQEDRLVLLLWKFLGPVLTQTKLLMCTRLCMYMLHPSPLYTERGRTSSSNSTNSVFNNVVLFNCVINRWMEWEKWLVAETDVYCGFVRTKPFHAESRLKGGVNSVGCSVDAAHGHFSRVPLTLNGKTFLNLQARKVSILL